METSGIYATTTTDMPQTNSPEMIKINFSVPAPLYEEALALAKLEGWKPAELHRMFWEKGFAAHAEGVNKRLVNKKLRKKLAQLGSDLSELGIEPEDDD
ncbi:hypothetical protein ACE1AT_04740 [Pelatocladus sp. BLCC-F211]|uniref:hypothetical protein n=1 Tax=Pelatocladus sp. BLCC-F211 TaxID=3342752 RepID=UPI0035B6E2B0